MTKVLVTGANGFIGRALTVALCQAGYTVRSAMRRPEFPLGPLGSEEVAVGDLGSQPDWTEALDGMEAVVHLAGRVHVMREHAQDPLAEFRKVNVRATEHLASHAANVGVRRFIYISSIGVNGNRTGLDPFREQDAPQPHNAYSVSKWEAEQALVGVSTETSMEYVVLRLPLVYGPGAKGNFLALLQAVRHGVPLPLASVDNRRSLISIGNLTSAIAKCLSCPAAAGKTYLVSDGEDVSTPELIRRMADALGSSARLWPAPVWLLRWVSGLAGQVRQLEQLIGNLVVDSSRIRQDLDWTPPVSMRDELRTVAAWFRGRRP